MTRVRAFELPSAVVGELVQAPFLLIFDKVPPESPLLDGESFTGIRDMVGAKAVLCFEEAIDIE